ncbi:MAG: radical SAM family heme chaperone HemW [bacterium]
MQITNNIRSNNTPYSVYIHWPFCHKKCHYCDFMALEQHGEFQTRYHEALLDEIEHWAQEQQKAGIAHAPSTIYIGGGTPSLYPLPIIKELFKTLQSYFKLENTHEITIEANPADITEEKLATWRELGINRLSMGVQILDDNILANLNRFQLTQNVYNAFKLIPKYFKNISIDLILGLPGTTDQIWDYTIKQALNWPITHISLYLLTIHEQTPLYFDIQQKKVVLPDEDKIIDTLEQTHEILENHGLKQYEISNYARPGYESVHNQGYWNRQAYKGFGLGASSFRGNTRTINEKNLDKYIKTIENNLFDLFSYTENLTQEQEKIEIIMLGLRRTSGIGLHDVVYLLNESEKKRFFENIEILKSQAHIKESNGRISLTPKGMLLENEVLARLI